MVPSHEYCHQFLVSNSFLKFNNEGTRMTSVASFWYLFFLIFHFLHLTLNINFPTGNELYDFTAVKIIISLTLLWVTNKLPIIWGTKNSFCVNPLSANPTKRSAVPNELFKCVWPFCGVGTWRVNWQFNKMCLDMLMTRFF